MAILGAMQTFFGPSRGNRRKLVISLLLVALVCGCFVSIGQPSPIERIRSLSAHESIFREIELVVDRGEQGRGLAGAREQRANLEDLAQTHIERVAVQCAYVSPEVAYERLGLDKSEVHLPDYGLPNDESLSTLIIDTGDSYQLTYWDHQTINFCRNPSPVWFEDTRIIIQRVESSGPADSEFRYVVVFESYLESNESSTFPQVE